MSSAALAPLIVALLPGPRVPQIVVLIIGILLAIAFVAFRGPGIFNLVLALSLGGWVGYARLVRGAVLRVKALDYVAAARAVEKAALLQDLHQPLLEAEILEPAPLRQ